MPCAQASCNHSTIAALESVQQHRMRWAVLGCEGLRSFALFLGAWMVYTPDTLWLTSICIHCFYVH